MDAELARRTVLKGGVLSAAAFIAGAPALRPSTAGAQTGELMGSWAGIPTSTADTVVVPEGHRAQPFIPWGAPINPSGPAFEQDATNTWQDQVLQMGMGHDGLHYFPINGSSTHGLLAVNHEYTETAQLFPDGDAGWNHDKTLKEQAAHGVAVVEIKLGADGNWTTVESTKARRIHVNTPMKFDGPAGGHRLLSTEADPAALNPVGTINNCGNGYTPWGTYLTTEENFNGYFWDETEGAADTISEEQAAINKRYGVAGQGAGYKWATTDQRFRADLVPQEPNRFGWIIEIDPQNPSSVPVKHTAMGRFKHEGAALLTAANGSAVVYMGDDERFDHIYKFVSAQPWKSEVAAGRSPLQEGTLYVARFDEGGKGVWLPLTQGTGPLTAENGFADQGDVLVKTRLAADAVGATPMDRPEWTTVNEATGEVFCTLTNNTKREEPNAANPRVNNEWGHIIKWKDDGDPAATTFDWDFFLLAGPGDGVDGSTIKSEDLFGSPDGLWIDPRGRMWIETDGDQPDESNNQMLLADPATGDLKRFLTGPVDCEVTGLTATPDGTTLFVNIQHPGDSGPADNPTETSNWPDGPGAGRPRPATVAIRRVDGGVVGSDGPGQAPDTTATGASTSVPVHQAGDKLAFTGTGTTNLAAVGALAAGAGAALLRFRNRNVGPQSADRGDVEA